MLEVKSVSENNDGREDIILNIGGGKIVLQQEAYRALGASYETLKTVDGLAVFFMSIAISLSKPKEIK